MRKTGRLQNKALDRILHGGKFQGASQREETGGVRKITRARNTDGEKDHKNEKSKDCSEMERNNIIFGNEK
jgi:hypothetical protein